MESPEQMIERVHKLADLSTLDTNDRSALRYVLDEAEMARKLAEVLEPVVPPVFHSSVPLSWEIYTAFTAGGSLHRYTVDQAKRAQSALAAWKARCGE